MGAAPVAATFLAYIFSNHFLQIGVPKNASKTFSFKESIEDNSQSVGSTRINLFPLKLLGCILYAKPLLLFYAYGGLLNKTKFESSDRGGLLGRAIMLKWGIKLN